MAPTQKSKYFKRHFSKKNKLFCFCCCKFETAIKIWIILMTVIIGIDALFGQTGLSFLFYIILFISHILLCIGLFKKINAFLKQFKIIFGIYLLYIIIRMIIYIIYGIFFAGVSVLNYDIYNYDIDYEDILIFLIAYIAEFIFFLYYYICVYTYIEDIEEELFNIEQMKNLEDNIFGETTVPENTNKSIIIT